MIISFFKKLFGKKETESEQLAEVAQVPSISITTETILSESINIAPTNKETKKSNKFPEIKIKFFKIMENEGFISVTNFINESIASNNIEFKELVYFLREIAQFMKKDKSFINSESINYINSQIDKFEEKNQTKYFTEIAYIHFPIGIRYSIEYLENKLNDILSKKNIPFEYFYSIMLLGNYYLRSKHIEKASNILEIVLVIIRNNKDIIEYKELISILSEISLFMKKVKTFSDTEVMAYINEQLENFIKKDNIEDFKAIANLMSKVDINYSIEYLENKLGSIDTVKPKNPDLFETLLLLSNYYVLIKHGDQAFKTIQRAILLVTNFNDKFDYITKQRIIAEKSSDVCLKGWDTPHYADYIHYEIVAFILDISNNICDFPHLSEFFRLKKNYFSKERNFGIDDDVNQALLNLQILNHKNELLMDIYNFTFNILPIEMGIPKEYLKENLLEPFENLSNDFDKNYPKWQKIKYLSEKFEKRPFKEIVIIHEFAGNIVKKYCDLENKNNQT